MFDSNSTNLLNDQRIVATLLPIESGHTQIKKKKWKKTKKKKRIAPPTRLARYNNVRKRWQMASSSSNLATFALA